jgi:two-component system cell cycle sensor histidine kinase/response regulator CckA
MHLGVVFVRDGPVIQEPAVTSVGQVPMDRLRSIFDGMFDGIWLVGPDGRTTYVNGAMAGLLGSTPEAMHGRPLTDFLDKSLWPVAAAFLARQRVQAGERMELTLLRGDRTDLFGIVAGSPIFTTEGVFIGTMLNVSDVTGKHAMDEQMVQNQRMEAIGHFAGGIAHDFNNLLTAIRGFAELARMNVRPDDPVRDDLDQVIAGAQRAAAITRKLLAFTRRQVLVPADVDPAQVITDLLPILEVLLGRDVEIELKFDADHGWVRVDPTQLEQVIVNLSVNARDSMPRGGELVIAVHDLPPTDADRPDPDLTAGPFVRIGVTDTGTGMDEATKSRIFDPFFTTKALGQGTGLGLSTVFKIVAQSGGQIMVETTPGQGSTFNIDLPRVDRVEVARPGLSEAPLQTTGVVLLVEDEPSVREFARRGLELAGYTVIAAPGGEEALEASERHQERIDVLVTDISMPGISGTVLAARIKETRPGIGVVFVSGSGNSAVVPGAGRVGVSGEFLPKPFGMEALGRAVARAANAGRKAAKEA